MHCICTIVCISMLVSILVLTYQCINAGINISINVGINVSINVPMLVSMLVSVLVSMYQCWQVSVHPAVVEQCHKLAELGWLYRRINNYIKSRTQDNSLGLVMQVLYYMWFLLHLNVISCSLQSFLAALSLELTEYYRLIAVLEAQVSLHTNYCSSFSLLSTIIFALQLQFHNLRNCSQIL